MTKVADGVDDLGKDKEEGSVRDEGERRKVLRDCRAGVQRKVRKNNASRHVCKGNA
jgi:hypothetical protein